MTIKNYAKLVSLLLLITACGTGIGNGIFDPTGGGPSASPSQINLNFNRPIQDYIESDFADCGDYYVTTAQSQINAGRQCIRDALDTCTESKYLLDKQNANGSRFTSFVSIQETTPGNCQIRVHTVSSVESNFGDQEATCASFDDNLIPELACGILD